MFCHLCNTKRINNDFYNKKFDAQKLINVFLLFPRFLILNKKLSSKIMN